MRCRCAASTVTPGDATVRRNSDLAIRAAVEGFHPREVQVFVRFADQPGLGARADAARRPIASRASSSSCTRCAARCSTTSMRKARAAPSTTWRRRSAAHRARAARRIAIRSGPGSSRRRTTNRATSAPSQARTSKSKSFADAPLDAPALIVDGTTGELVQQGRSQHRQRSRSRSPAAIRSARASPTSSWR